MFFYSYILLWVLVIGLTFSNLLILRRIAPPVPRLDMDDVGLEDGMSPSTLKFETISGKTVDLVQSNKSGTLALYLAANCGACSNVLADLHTYIKKHNDLSVVIFMQGESEHEIAHKVGDLLKIVPVVILSEDYKEIFRISLFPFAYFLSPKGVVLAKGGVPAGNPHLELLTHLALSENKKKMVS
ncbi:hypothetical protein ABEY41_03945 [Peribacillus butanolivorans]|uniref:hypothetical protein n=1 Tax=Peribacillus butanolivorans TaxID=421767 RepID=UPI003D2ADB0B